MSLNAPSATWSVASPTTLSLAVTGSEGDTVHTLWREVPSALPDRVGPTITGDGTLVLGPLPLHAGGVLVTLYRDTGAGGFSRPYSFPASLVVGDSLAGALGRLWGLSPGLTAVCGPLFSQETPESLNGQKLALPWTILSYEHSGYDWSFESTYWETTTCEFSCFALGNQKVEDALAAIHTHLDWQRLPFNSLSTSAIRVEPVDYKTASTFARHRSGEVVWKGCLTYSITVQRDHPRWKPHAV